MVIIQLQVGSRVSCLKPPTFKRILDHFRLHNNNLLGKSTLQPPKIERFSMLLLWGSDNNCFSGISTGLWKDNNPCSGQTYSSQPFPSATCIFCDFKPLWSLSSLLVTNGTMAHRAACGAPPCLLPPLLSSCGMASVPSLWFFLVPGQVPLLRLWLVTEWKHLSELDRQATKLYQTCWWRRLSLTLQIQRKRGTLLHVRVWTKTWR